MMRVLVFWLLVCAGASLYAQAAPMPNDAAHSIEFYTMAWEEPVTDLLYGNPEGGELKRFIASRSRPGGPYRYSGPGPLYFGKMGQTEEGLPIFVPEASVPITGSSAAEPVLYVFLRKAEGDGNGFRIYKVDGAVGADDAGGGAVLFVNMSHLQIGGLLNDERFMIPPGGKTRVTPKAGDNNNLILRLAKKDVSEGEWSVGYNTVWGERERNQSLIFIVSDPDNADKILVKRVLINRQGGAAGRAGR